MAAVTTAVIAIAAVILGWITIEIACKPCLEKGRDAMDRALDPNYDPDSDSSSLIPPQSQSIQQPLLLDPSPPPPTAPPSSTKTILE